MAWGRAVVVVVVRQPAWGPERVPSPERVAAFVGIPHWDQAQAVHDPYAVVPVGFNNNRRWEECRAVCVGCYHGSTYCATPSVGCNFCWIISYTTYWTMSENFVVVGQNNRNALVQSKKLAPYHEDMTRRQPFEPASVAPGQYSKIKIDCKHATDREIILNDLRLRFQLDLSDRTNVGNVFAVRGTDLIRSLVLKINEDIIFQADKHRELTHLWLMNNHKLGGERKHVRDSYLLNAGVIPSGSSPSFFYKTADKGWYINSGLTDTIDTAAKVTNLTRPGLETHDGLPRLVYSDVPTDKYRFLFDISFNELVGPIFPRFHLRRVEYIQVEIMFEPWVSTAQTQNFLLFAKDPVSGTPALDHPYSKAKFTNLEIVQYRSTLLDSTHGFTLPDTRMLSWLMHRYSRREYTVDFSKATTTVDLQLHDWEIRTNITRVYWMLAPKNPQASGNGFAPYAAPCEPYEQLTGVEILWKNDKVLDLKTFHQVYRHYVLSENKRHSLNDPYIDFQRLLKSNAATRTIKNERVYYTWDEETRDADKLWTEHYEMPIYHVDLNMNILSGVSGAEIIGGIVNDTSDYVIRLKRVLRDDNETTPADFTHSSETSRVLYVWLEYQTLVNLAAGSNQFNRGSQVVTKQLNVSN